MKTRKEKTKDFDRLLEEERLILSSTELIYELMDEAGVTKAELARRIGRSRGFVSQILDGSRNMTLRTLSSVAYALGARIDVAHRPLSTPWWQRAKSEVKPLPLLYAELVTRSMGGNASERLAGLWRTQQRSWDIQTTRRRFDPNKEEAEEHDRELVAV